MVHSLPWLGLAFFAAALAWRLAMEWQSKRAFQVYVDELEFSQNLLKNIRVMTEELAHDLKGPLANIVSTSQALELIARSVETEGVSQCLYHLQQESEKGLISLTNFIDFQLALLGHVRERQISEVHIALEVIRVCRRVEKLHENCSIKIAVDEEMALLGFVGFLPQVLQGTLGFIAEKSDSSSVIVTAKARRNTLHLTIAGVPLDVAEKTYAYSESALTNFDAKEVSLSELGLITAFFELRARGADVTLTHVNREFSSLEFSFPEVEAPILEHPSRQDGESMYIDEMVKRLADASDEIRRLQMAVGQGEREDDVASSRQPIDGRPS